MFNTASVINFYIIFTLILSFCLYPDLRVHKEGDLVIYMRVQRLKWAGHVVTMFDNRAPKQIVGEYTGERGPVGKSRNEWEDEVLKGVPKLLNTKTWRTAEKHRGDGRKKTDQEEEDDDYDDDNENNKKC